MPEPRTIDAIKADPELADWCREADLVLIPLLLDRGSSRRVNISRWLAEWSATKIWRIGSGSVWCGWMEDSCGSAM